MGKLVGSGTAARDRRSSILDAALRLSAREGLNNLTTSAVSREAGIAAGTLFLYFDTKEALLNALYTELVRRRNAAILAGMEEALAGDRLRAYWYALAHWYLDDGDVPRVIQQCEASSVLTQDSLDFRDHLDETMRRRYFPESDDLLALPLRRQVFHALLTGPVLVLAQLRDKGEIPITDDLLDETYRRVLRALAD
jgi:AcrR family transcriptional regulator